MKKIILDLCGGTGAWSKPYQKAGYDVRIISLPGFFTFKDCDVKTYIPPSESVYGILAAPPCTMFSIARNERTAKEKRNFREGMEIVIACLRIIWECRYKNKLAFWCLENPRGFLRQFLGNPVMTFRAYEYGDLWSKPTDLWGYFKAPKKKPVDKSLTQLINREVVRGMLGTDKKARRAITPPGFAKAFFEANK